MFEPVPPPLTVAEVLVVPDQAAAWLAAEVPGPDGLAASSLLDPGGLSHAGRVDLLAPPGHHYTSQPDPYPTDHTPTTDPDPPPY